MLLTLIEGALSEGALPISIISTVAKIFGKNFHDQFYSYLSNFNLLSTNLGFVILTVLLQLYWKSLIIGVLTLTKACLMKSFLLT